ncbi:uncharacterized protein LOC128228782 [Mya arenaria]|uniref:uncharacterized protein LOC128228782 n=1 Tax=Mya arenaria TaxID=6604 RepID=UPI0022DF168A|nr:uncharacterized protein LOC128228782 [Mya arenaria]
MPGSNGKITLLKFVVLPVVMILLGGLLSNQSCNQFMKHSFRRTIIHVLPFLDWTQLYETNCFVPNPLAESFDRPLLNEDCKICSNVSEVTVLLDTSEEDIANHFSESDMPLVILGQNLQPTVSMETLAELYLDEENMNIYTSCEFASSLPIMEVRNQRGLLLKARAKQIHNFYASWQNCFTEAAKTFRQLYTKPEFLPSALELDASNWVFICEQYTERKLIKMPMLDQFMVLLQLNGELELIFTPRQPCLNNCTQLTTTLEKGGSLMVTDFLYDIEYVTCLSRSSLTVGLAGRIDL